MTIKVGDIVRYKGTEQRVMMCGVHGFLLSHDRYIDEPLDNLDLVDSVTLPNLEVSDWVIVNNIPMEEKKLYLTPWYDGCESIVTSDERYQIRAIYDTVDYGKVIRLDQHMFLPYHLTKIDGYDII